MIERFGAGTLQADLSHILGGVMLLLSFALLSQRRVAAMLQAWALQSWVLAAAFAWQGYLQQAPLLFGGAIVILAVQGAALPLGLHRLAARLHLDRGTDNAPRIFSKVSLGVALIALAILVVLPTSLQSQGMTREDLALALSIVLLGLSILITRHGPVAQVIGVLSLQNGLLFATLGVTGAPLATELSLAALLPVMGVTLGLFDRFGARR